MPAVETRDAREAVGPVNVLGGYKRARQRLNAHPLASRGA